MIFLNPAFPDVTGSNGILLKWAQDCISKFYYLSDEDLLHRDKSRISYSVSHDARIAIFGYKQRKGATPLLSWNGNKNVQVVSAITFRQGIGKECYTALVTWLSVF